jgi:hypothetical protein
LELLPVQPELGKLKCHKSLAVTLTGICLITISITNGQIWSLCVFLKTDEVFIGKQHK